MSPRAPAGEAVRHSSRLSSLSAVLPGRVRAGLRRALDAAVIVLVYHRVLPKIGRDPHRLAVSTANFAQHMAWLATHARPIGETQLVEAASNGWRWTWTDCRPRVLVTFDDGYADNLHHALPILRRHRIPATVFVATGYTGRPEPFWWDALTQLVFEGNAAPHGDREATHAELHRRLKVLPPAERRAELAHLSRNTNIEPHADDDSRPMTWDELRAWRAAGLSIGGHTRSHPCLALLTNEQLCEEISGCSADLCAALNLDARLFAYPYGSRDAFDARCETAVHAAGFACGLANRDGDARWASSPFALPRCLVRDWDPCEFEARFRRWCP